LIARLCLRPGGGGDADCWRIVLLDEVDAVRSPWPDNRLIFAPGLLVGHMLSSTDRISIGAKSPMTGGVKEANAGGRTGLHMAYLGMHALIIEGQPAVPGLWVLHLSAHGAKWHKADDRPASEL
jgi:aldehyde:ferredoxin oxidoreductase